MQQAIEGRGDRRGVAEELPAETATHAGGSGPPDPFRMLVRWIRQGAELGRTSGVRSFDRYFEEKRAEQRNSLFAIPRVPPTR